MTENKKNILIVKPSALGDIIMALPALSALRKKFPQAKISWLVRPEFADILRQHPLVDEVILFDRKFLGKAWYNIKALSAIFALIKTLRDRNFDLTVDLQGLFRTAGLCWLSGCKKRFGMADGREFAPIFYTDKVTPGDDAVHMVDYYLKVAHAAGGDISQIDFAIPQNYQADIAIDNLLKKHNITRGNYVVLMPGSAHQDKCWSVDRFAAVADKIKTQFDFDVIAVGSKSEKPLCDNLIAAAKSHVINLAGQTNISELVSLIRGAKLAITNDTGPGHIAVALGVEVVFLFGPSNPARIGPYKKDDSFIAVAVDSWQREFRSSDPKYCIDAITVEQVYEKVSKKLKKIVTSN
ncbi:MAG TPA: glycosyltransferase family 9 protein [Sedimentisphaerales bacterium]|nr:glycosyltransferase family 9 protein [Sedimentisphaerales bacterium]